MPQPLTLDGPRLCLRPWRDSDRDAIAALNADPAAMRHFVAPMTRAESDAWITRLQAHIDAEGWGFWAVERHATPGCIGAVGLMRIPWDAQTDRGQPIAPAVEIGWRIAPAQQRQGFAEEAARLALAAGFGPIGLDAVVAFTVPGNAPSWRLMERLGLTRIGRFAHPRVPEGHPLREHLLYRIDRAAWVATRLGG